jgi:1,4-alpha-glucan branching enzyme
MEDGLVKWTHGPSFEDGGIRFRLWAPGEKRVELLIDGQDDLVAMTPAADGFFESFVNGLGAGARYAFALSGGRRVPDPASRFRPEDVNGLSEAIDPAAYRWREPWPGRDWDDIVLYELHLGAFSPE